MWVEKLPNGKFKFCERYTDPITGSTLRVSVTLDKHTKTTEKLAREILREKALRQDPPDTTLKELVDLYLEERKTTVKASTWIKSYHTHKATLSILGSDTQVNSLTAGYIRKKFLATGEAPSTLNERLTRLKALLRWGYKNDYVQDIRFLDKLDNFSDVPHRQKIEDKFIEREELESLLNGMDRWHDLTAFLALSGLRFGEAAALTRQDLMIPLRIINVDKTYDTINKVVTTPKTYTSTREVYMQDELYELCLHLIDILNISGLVFSQNGGYIQYATYNKYLKQKSQKILGRAITPHVLRHTHASLLMEQGVDIDTISARLGHSDSKITREIYLHVTEKLKEKRNAEIKEIKIFAPFMPHK